MKICIFLKENQKYEKYGVWFASTFNYLFYKTPVLRANIHLLANQALVQLSQIPQLLDSFENPHPQIYE